MWIILAFCLPVPAAADAARFDRAVAQWLEGDDARSLPELAALAADGHPMARILLSQIEVKDRGHSPFRKALKPSEARALFRRDQGYGGFSQTWLAFEAKSNNPLARALIATRVPRPVDGLIGTLRALGEVEATDYPIRVIALYGSEEAKRRLAESDMMLDELRPYLAYHRSTQTWRGEGIAALRHIAPFAAEMITEDEDETVEIGGLLALGVAAGGTDPANRWRGLVEDWVLTAPATRPIADLCRARCPGEVTGCGFAMLALSGGYYEVVRLDTPLETVIPQEAFLASPRARLMALRRAALAKHNANRGWVARQEEIADMSVCASDLVAQTRAMYE
ncbi:MAG: hypothetical protein AAFY25_11690 [Pseudomonadota bacterium]